MAACLSIFFDCCLHLHGKLGKFPYSLSCTVVMISVTRETHTHNCCCKHKYYSCCLLFPQAWCLLGFALFVVTSITSEHPLNFTCGYMQWVFDVSTTMLSVLNNILFFCCFCNKSSIICTQLPVSTTSDLALLTRKTLWVTKTILLSRHILLPNHRRFAVMSF